jgi:hypothetical protein
MPIVSITMSRTKRLMHKAAFVVAAMQIVVGSAPLLESGSQSARAHIEANGIQLHHAHDDASCVACAANRLLSGAETLHYVLPAVRPGAHCNPPTLVSHDVAATRRHEQSRAPPRLILF